VKTILIIVLLHTTASVTVVEFDDAPSCERAADAVRKLASVRTVCTPKGS